jgi:hypothetical protein
MPLRDLQHDFQRLKHKINNEEILIEGITDRFGVAHGRKRTLFETAEGDNGDENPQIQQLHCDSTNAATVQ